MQNKEDQKQTPIQAPPIQSIPQAIVPVQIQQTNASEQRELDRYLAYFGRVRQMNSALLQSFLRAKRYLAYTSDVGESFRPILSPRWVQFCYGISWVYVLGDCSYQSYSEKKSGESDSIAFRTFVSQFTFQAVASMAIPAVIIHTAVAQTINLLTKEHIAKKVGPKVIQWGPSAVGLAIIPFLPLVDHPVEIGLEYIFDNVWKVDRKHPKHSSHH